MMALMPMITMIVNAVWFGVKPSRVSILTVPVALFGVLLVITHGNLSTLISLQDNWLGDFLIFLGATCWVIYTIGGTRFSEWSTLHYSTLTTFYGTVSVAIIACVGSGLGWVHVPDLAALGATAWDMCYMIAVAGVLALFCWNTGTKIIGPANSVLFINLVPVTTMRVKWAMGTRFHSLEVAGAFLTITALVIHNVVSRIHARHEKPAPQFIRS
jgi:drug/metabolite transporter (DMT)-like permease